jgi:elongation factor P
VEIGEITKGTKVLIDGVPYSVDEYSFVKPGKGRAIYRLRIRNMYDNTSLDKTYHSGDKLEEASISATEAQYLYAEADHYVFMDNKTFEQYFISKDQMAERIHFLKPGFVVNILLLQDRPIDVTIPKFVELVVKEAQAASKADTVTSQNKIVVMETGVSLGVPTFVKEGDIIKVDTRTGTYVERVGTAKG